MKKISLYIVLPLAGLFLFKAELFSQSGLATAAPAIKTFALQGDIAGAASNSVNLFTGDVALPLNLVTLPGNNGLDATVNISYTSNVRHIVDNWNLESPAGILGLGWSMDFPKIVCDNKQTGARDDDDYYLVEGGASNLLVRTTSGSDGDGAFYKYETKNLQFWIVKFYYNENVNKWVIIKEDGTRFVYGDKNSNRSTIQWIVRWGNWIGNSSQITGQSQQAVIWNLSQIINVWNEQVTFEYENVEQFVGSSSGKKHTEASYLKSITDVWGRKVSFVYKDKQSPYYMETHTEKAEPDAYQEVYERKYLDKIEVLPNGVNKLITIQFGYNIINSGNNTAKMLLTSIIQKNAAGNTLPGMKFSYNQSGAVKGMLSTVTYPSGGIITYTYTEKQIGHSDRQLLASAPSGYAEPKVWLAEDYAVVAWRQLGSGGSHDSNPRDVKLYAYQWVGEWKEEFLQTISNVSLEGAAQLLEYKDFQVTLEKDFFAVLSRASSSSDVYHLFLRCKNQNSRGNWGATNSSNNYGTGTPILMSGTNFVAVGSNKDDNTHPSYFYLFQGNSFHSTTVNQTTGLHVYTATNNYIINHNRQVDLLGQSEFNFYYLTEDRKWITKNWGSPLKFSSFGKSYWHGANSMAICMAAGNPEYAYRWDNTYTNFFRDLKDKLNNDLFGGLTDHAPVFIISNSLVGINGRLARYDGYNWTTATITSTQNSIFDDYFSYGDDYVVRPTQYDGPTLYKGGRKVFNPNTLNWEADVIMNGADRGKDHAVAGIDNYYFGNGHYYRQPNGTWVKKHTYSSYDMLWLKGGWPRFTVLHGLQYKYVQGLRYFKNGEISSTLSLPGGNLLYSTTKFKSNGVGAQTIVTYSSGFPDADIATSIYLTRMVDDAVSGKQKDHPVTLITVNDGIGNRYITLDYNTTTATIDPTGTVTQYNEITEMPGSSSAGSKPHGYTKTFFYNGLTSAELGVPFMPVDLLWSGAPYKKEVYDKDNVLKASEKTAFQTFTKILLNDAGTKVKLASFARVTETRTVQDGVETVTTNDYDANTGLIKQSNVSNFDSKNSTARVYYKYFWEQYDPTRSLNILSPVIQVKKTIWGGGVESVTESSANTWKQWNNVYAPHKSYTWKNTGSPDFNFSAWSGTGEPTADWYKLSEYNSLSNKGNVLQATKN